MKATVREKVTCAAFCAFLGIVAVLFFVLPKAEYSETEKRYLAEAPVLSWESLTSGEFGSDMETYMADHIPGRDIFVGLHAYFDLLTGRQVAKDIYLTQNGALVEAPIKWNEEQANKNVSSVNALAERLGVSVDFMILPSAGWASKDSISGLSDPYEDEALIRQLYAMASDKINCLDMLSVFAAQSDPAALYYKTDHHWTSLGAYTAYAAYLQAKDREPLQMDDFNIVTADGFRGSTYSRAALWLTPGETIEMWHGSDRLQVTTLEDPTPHDGVFYTERLEEADMYTAFLDGNHPLVRIHNPDAAGKGSILVIRDSYANCLGTILANSYENVVLVDLRYYHEDVAKLHEVEQFNDILVCYSLSNFMTDTNLVWLK